MNYSIDDLIKLIGLMQIEILSLRQEVADLQKKNAELLKMMKDYKKK